MAANGRAIKDVPPGAVCPDSPPGTTGRTSGFRRPSSASRNLLLRVRKLEQAVFSPDESRPEKKRRRGRKVRKYRRLTRDSCFFR